VQARERCVEARVVAAEQRPEVALRLGSALGDCRPASDAFSPRLLASLLLP
jgi:hypothetical protein